MPEVPMLGGATQEEVLAYMMEHGLTLSDVDPSTVEFIGVSDIVVTPPQEQEVFQETIPGKTEIAQAGVPLLPLIGGLWGLWQTIEELFGDQAGGVSQVSNGVDLYGAAGIVGNGGGVPVGGWGVPEPPAAMVAKQWKTKAFSHTVGEYWVYFFRLIDGRIMCYNAAKKTWKMWRPKKPLAVLYRGKTTLSQAVKVQSYLDKLWRNVAKRTKAVKMA